jgi:hypothetical protein
MAPSAYTAVWDAEGMHAISIRQVQLVRDIGALSKLPLYLSHLGIARLWMGDLAGATSLIGEIDSVVAATGSRIASYTLLRLRAMQGREAEATTAIAAAVEQATAGGQGWQRPGRTGRPQSCPRILSAPGPGRGSGPRECRCSGAGPAAG